MLKKALGFYLLTLLAGGGDVVEMDNITPPTVSNLTYSQESIVQKSGIWTRAINGTVDFKIHEGNIASVTIEGVGNRNLSTFPVAGAGDITSGSLAIYAIASTSTAQIAHFNVWVSDSGGSVSNMLPGSLIINASVAPMNTKHVEWEIVSVELVEESRN